VEEKDREVLIDRNRVYLGQEGIIYITSVGWKDEQIALDLRDAYLKLANMVEGKVDLLVDASRAGQPSTRARRIFQEDILEHEKTGKVAIIGACPVAAVIVSFLRRVTGKGDMSFFSKKEAALKWLKK
jgi:hypothetical protein